MASTSPEAPASSSSSVTATEHDVESQAHSNRVGHFALIFDQAGVTHDVLHHKYRGEGTNEAPYVVDFLPEDAHNPQTYSLARKWTITILQALAALAVAFVSTAYSGSIREILIEFRVSTEVAILGVSLFVLGFAIGPLLWAPLSELYGRQYLFIATYFALTAFNAGAAGSQNIQTLIIMRFFAGSFGSSPLTNAGGVLVDMFSAKDRGVATAIFAAAPFLGPAIGPIVGGFLGETEGWRWVEGVMAIFTGVLMIVCALLIPETYAPVLLRRRANKLSKMTGKKYISVYDANRPPKTVTQEFKIALSRPWILLFKEPIVLLSSIYIAIVYGTLYLLFAAFPIVYQQERGWSPGIGGLAFLGVAVGVIVAVLYIGYDNKRYTREVIKHGGMAPPEARLQPAIVGSVLLPIGLFWFAWTNGPDIHWAVSIVASGLFGTGLVLVFLTLISYLIDSYVIYAASVLAANAVIRSCFGAAFPLFTTYMYQNLGIHWASSIPAFLALACMPFPLLFLMYGAKIREMCKFASEASAFLAKIRAAQQQHLQPESSPAADIDELEAEAEKSGQTTPGGVLSDSEETVNGDREGLEPPAKKLEQ